MNEYSTAENTRFWEISARHDQWQAVGSFACAATAAAATIVDAYFTVKGHPGAAPIVGIGTLGSYVFWRGGVSEMNMRADCKTRIAAREASAVLPTGQLS